jgi:GNAT superfamily N-acetyltransferase
VIQIRSAQKRDETAWKALWAAYNAFYGADIPARVTNRTWTRLIDKRSSLFCRLAVDDDGAVIGFANAVLHEGTWVSRPICYLEDLFVAPAARKRGVATALIEDLIRLGRAKKWSRIYWHTHATNAAARHVYDRFAKADGFVRYRLFLK